MIKKRILLVTNGFFPEISPRSLRATELAKEYSRQGHSVVVISKYRDYDYSDFLHEYKLVLKMWGKSKLPIIPDFKTKPFSFFSRFLKRLLLMFFEYPNIDDMFKVRKMLRHENGYDLLISFAVPYPVHWGTAWTRSNKHNIAETWVADCGDPYMGDRVDSFRKLFYFKYLEKWFCRKADFIAIPVESAKPGYYSEFQNKIEIIPQGFDFNLSQIMIERKPGSIPKFAYAGRFLSGGVREPDILMQYLLEINLPFEFYVFTIDPSILTEYVNALKGKLIVSGYIDRVDLMNRLKEMDFLINYSYRTTLNVPIKLIEYAIAGRPVLNIDDNFSKDDLIAFLKGDFQKRMILPNPEIYHVKNVSQQFLQLLDSKSI